MAKQNPAFAKYQAILKKVRKDHPSMKFATAQKEAAKIFHSGAKVTGKKTAKSKPKTAKVGAAPVKRKAAAKTKVAGTRKRRTAPAKVFSTKKVTTIGRGAKLEAEIIRLEALRKKATIREYKDLLQLQINQNHKLLKALHKRI